MFSERAIIIGDVHGCLDELDALLSRLAPRRGDRLIFVGDLVSRGPASALVVRRVREVLEAHPGSLCLAGNHEHHLLWRRESRQSLPRWAGGLAPDDWAFLASLPLLVRLPQWHAVVVHAGFQPAYFRRFGAIGTVPLSWRYEVSERCEALRWFLRVRRVDADGEPVSLREGGVHHRHWSTLYDGGEGFAFFGHDARPDDPTPRVEPHAIGLDTGCVYGGRLTAAVLSPGEGPAAARYVSVPGTAHADHVRMPAAVHLGS